MVELANGEEVVSVTDECIKAIYKSGATLLRATDCSHWQARGVMIAKCSVGYHEVDPRLSKQMISN